MPQTRLIEWTLDAETFEGLLALPDSPAKGSVLICHAWGGRGGHEEDFAERLAGMGYAAMAGDVYGKDVRGSTNEECEALMMPLAQDRAKLQGRLLAALSALTAQNEVDPSNVIAAGFCFGGLSVLDLARANAPVKGVAAFHAILGKPELFSEGTITPEVIAFQGFDDPMAGPDDLKAFGIEMTERKARWQLQTFGQVAHAFTNEAANQPENGLQFEAFARDRSYEAFDQFAARLLG